MKIQQQKFCKNFSKSNTEGTFQQKLRIPRSAQKFKQMPKIGACKISGNLARKALSEILK